MGEFNQQKYKNEYDKKTYKNFGFRVRKEEAEQIIEFIKNNTDLSINAFIKEAVDEKIERMKKEGI